MFMAFSTFFGGRAIAESDKVKAVAWQAKGTAEDAYALANDLKVQIADVRGVQEISRKEYRDDRIRDAQYLREMEARIINAIKG